MVAPVTDDELRKYLALTTTPLVREFISATIRQMPDDVAQFMFDFARAKVETRTSESGKPPARLARGTSPALSSSSDDTESLVLGSTRPPSPRVGGDLVEDFTVTDSCPNCVRLEEAVHALHLRFLSVTYELIRLSKVPPWDASDEIRKARKKTPAHCKAVCVALKNAGLVQQSSPQAEDLDPDGMVCKTRGGGDSSSSSFKTDDSDDVASLPDVFERFPVRWRAGARESVCAESQSALDHHELPKYQKSHDELSRIRSCIEKCFIWACISKEETDIRTLLETMKPVEIPAGKILMRQGDTGDGMYFVDNGRMTVERETKDGPKHLRDVGPGEVVGELAVLYRTSRSSTVKAISACSLWFLDRHSFNSLVRGSAKAKRDRFDQFLKSVPILGSMGLYSRGRLADVLEEEVFQPEDIIIREGDTKVDKCYLVYDGVVTGHRAGDSLTHQYKRGDMFGECGILFDTCRLATVSAVTKTKVVTIERRSFKRVFQDVYTELLAQTMSKYPESRPPMPE